MTKKDFDKNTQEEKQQFPIAIYFDVKNLSRGSLGDSEVFPIDSGKIDIPLDDENILTTFTGEVSVMRLEEDLLANFTLNYQTESICARCVNNYSRKGSLTFDREYLVFGKDEKGEKLHIEKHFKINVGTPIYEELMFDIPLKPICRENCKGNERVNNK